MDPNDILTGIDLNDFEETITYYLDMRLRLYHQPSSVTASGRDLRLMCQWCHATRTTVVNGSAVLEFFSWCRDVRNNRSGSINRKRASICTYIRFLRATQKKGAMAFPLEFLPRARQAYAGPVKILEPDETNKLLYSIDRSILLGYRDFVLYSLQYGIGLRLGEALKLNIADLNFENKTILIHGKGRKERTLPLSIEALYMLRQYLKHRKKFLNAATSPALFLSKKGNRLAMRTAEENFQKIVEKAGPFDLLKVVPHTLRHCFASHALDREKDLLMLKALLGHALLRSTEIYLHPSMDLMRKTVDNHVACESIAQIRSERKWIRGMQHHKSG